MKCDLFPPSRLRNGELPCKECGGPKRDHSYRYHIYIPGEPQKEGWFRRLLNRIKHGD
jgi:hypothetical protein